MRAVVIWEHGGLDKLQVVDDWPMPEVRAHDVLVEVKACALNYLDIFVRRGMPGLPIPLPHISGGDIAGVIVEIGREVRHCHVGQRVLINPASPEGMLGEELQGGMAEYVRTPATHVIPLPDTISFEQAAALPVAYGTAWRQVVERGKVAPMETVLILGASGGVGTGAVQIAKYCGAIVWACASSAEKLRRLKALGADEVINYREVDFSTTAWQMSGRKGVDVIIDNTGAETWVKSLRTLRRGGRLLTCGATTGFDPKTDIRYIWRRELTILGCNGWTQDGLEKLLTLVARGIITPVIDRILPLEQAAAAEAAMERREIFGKIILKP